MDHHSVCLYIYIIMQTQLRAEPYDIQFSTVTAEDGITSATIVKKNYAVSLSKSALAYRQTLHHITPIIIMYTQ